MQPNTTNKNSVHYLCSLQHASADIYGHHQEVTQLHKTESATPPPLQAVDIITSIKLIIANSVEEH